MKIISALLIALTLSACSKKAEVAEEKAPPKPSTIQTAIGGFTGQTAVKQGKKAQKQIIEISEQQNKDLDEVMQ